MNVAPTRKAGKHRRSAIQSPTHDTPPGALPVRGERMGRDSNSRGLLHPTRFPGVRLKPLGHPSINRRRQAAHITPHYSPLRR